MKKRFFACVLLLLFCLSSCSPSDGPTQYSDFCLTAEIKTRTVKKDERFKIEVTFGQRFGVEVHNEAIFKIESHQLEILFYDGTRAEKTYERKISDFNHYGFFGSKGHTENICFAYKGTEDEYYGKIRFEIRTVEDDDDLGDGIALGDSVDFYYIVRDDYITVTTKLPKEYKPQTRDY